MIVNMSANATKEQIEHVMDRIKECGFLPHLIQGAERTVIGVVGKNRGRRAEVEALRVAPGVDEILIISQPYTLVSLELRPQRTVVDVKGVKIGGPDLVVMAGPCSVESREQLMETARGVKAPARICCAAARTSRALRRTISRASASKGSRSWRKRGRKPACLSSPK